MKKEILITLAASITLNLSAGNNFKSQTSGSGESSTSFFLENKGQIVDQNYIARRDVLYSGNSNGMTFFLRNNGISYQLFRVDKWKAVDTGQRMREEQNVIDKQTIYRIDINWLNADLNPTITKGKLLDGVTNYYTHGCPEDGILNVKTYQDVTYQNLYPKIDLKWYKQNGNLKYDYYCEAGADYKKIQLQIIGANKLFIDEKGDLVVSTPLGQIIEKAPVVIQNGNELRSRWVLKNNVIEFEIENLNNELPFTIDPLVRAWGTYYGGAGFDIVAGSTTDILGNLYIAGYTDSNVSTTIATSGTHQTVIGGNLDGFAVKFNASGVRQWGTYYGGSGAELFGGCAVDILGNVCLAGHASFNSGNVIATIGSHQTVFGGATYDAILVKLNANGLRLWGTYYGGSGSDIGYSCITDSIGNIFMVGSTETSTSGVIATIGSHQSSMQGTNDGFIVKFDASGVRQWGTYYGGASTDLCIFITIDNSGDIIISGSTTSSAGISTAGVHQPLLGGQHDAFLTKFTGSGVRLWGTYYGGTGYDDARVCAVNGSGDIVMTGNTETPTSTIIATANSHQSSYGGNSDGYIVKFNTSCVRLWSTYYGGNGLDYRFSCAQDSAGNVYLSGTTNSAIGTAIASSGSFQSTHGGNDDACLAKFNASGIREWGTYYGGNDNETSNTCTIDNFGNIYIAGRTFTSTANVIATPGSHQPLNAGATDGYVAKFFECLTVNTTLTSLVNTTCNGGNNGSATISASGGSSFTYNWLPFGGTSATASGLSAGTYTCTVTNECGSTTTQSVVISAPPPVLATVVSQNNVLCNNDSNGIVTLTATGGTAPYNYNWIPLGGNTSIASGLPAGVYTCTVTDSNNCIDNITVTVTEPSVLTATAVLTNPSNCGGNNGSINLTVAGGTPNYDFIWSNSTFLEDISVLTSGTYSVIIVDTNGCVFNASYILNDPPPPVINFSILNDTICQASGQPFVINTAIPAGGVFSGSAIINDSVFDPSLANIGFNLVTYLYVDPLGCSATAVDSIWVDFCTDNPLIGTEAQLFDVYPNPNNGVFTIIHDLNTSASVRIFDMHGKLVIAKDALTQTPVQFELTHSGVYLIEIIGYDNKHYTGRLIVID
ncbi:MAG: T9SS type A sorting domain-containing protein [Bacteroidia bacterium]|jgi:hypothetical protein|nr:T9SS type A sorting domain-containing protein [Bacteroidia bacterium]